MLDKITITSFVKEGRVSQQARLAIAEVLKMLDGKTVSISIKKQSKRSSDRMRNYYWAVIIPIATNALNHYGNHFDPEQTHEYLKQEVGMLGKNLIIRGRLVYLPGSIKKLENKEFIEYIERCIAWGAEWDVIIPYPNEII